MISPSRSSRVSKLWSRLLRVLAIGYESMITFVKSLARGDLPLSAEIPNSETREAMLQTLEGEDLKEWSDLEALKGTQGKGG
jgi:hypothetical protein